MQNAPAAAASAPVAPAAGTPGSHPPVDRTDFSRYSHQQLIAMLAAADPASAHRTAQNWDRTASLMSDQASALEAQLSGFSDKWQGDAAASYQVMITDLAKGVRQVADNARAMRDLSAHAADALDTARAQMPAPVDVPSLSPETMAMAATPITADPTTSASTLMAAQQQQSQAVAQVQAQQAASQAAGSAHAQAVQVMTTLATNYADSAGAIPDSPYAADGSVNGLTGAAGATGGTGFGTASGAASPLLGSPGSGGVLGGIGGIGDLVDPVTGQLVAGAGGVASNVPLFGGMFTAGLAAASAAAVGRFGSLLPKLPAFLQRRGTPETDTAGLYDPVTGAPLGAVPGGATSPLAGAGTGAGAGGALGGGAGGIGGAGIGGAGIGSIGGFGGVGGAVGAGGLAAAAPSAYSALTGAGAGGAGGTAGLPAASGLSGLSTGAVAAPAGTATTGATGGMPMGMMPMGQGMGGGMDGGRRSPAWLVETDDVWGEQSVVAPSVLGDDSAPVDPRPWMSGPGR